MLPVEQRITFKRAVMTYKCVHGTTADYLADYIRPPSSATANLHLRSTSSGRLFVLRSKTAAGDRSFAVAGPRLWNSLPTSITSAGSLAIYKKQLKKFLFRTAYDWHVLFTFSINSAKRLRSDLSLTLLYKLTYYVYITYIHFGNIPGTALSWSISGFLFVNSLEIKEFALDSRAWIDLLNWF